MRILAGTPQAGPLGLLVVVALGIAVAFLARSLIKHLNRVPKSFDPPSPPPRAGASREPGKALEPRRTPPSGDSSDNG
ncbi:MAG: hypothetical protein ACR2F6_16795 [Mycobacteriales bacterium]